MKPAGPICMSTTMEIGPRVPARLLSGFDKQTVQSRFLTVLQLDDPKRLFAIGVDPVWS
jgi:hypothetical protein